MCNVYYNLQQHYKRQHGVTDKEEMLKLTGARDGRTVRKAEHCKLPRVQCPGCGEEFSKNYFNSSHIKKCMPEMARSEGDLTPRELQDKYNWHERSQEEVRRWRLMEEEQSRKKDGSQEEEKKNLIKIISKKKDHEKEKEECSMGEKSGDEMEPDFNDNDQSYDEKVNEFEELQQVKKENRDEVKYDTNFKNSDLCEVKLEGDECKFNAMEHESLSENCNEYHIEHLDMKMGATEEAEKKYSKPNDFDGECHECHKIFKSTQTLGYHVKYWHLKGVYPCILCGDNFELKGKLKNHIASKHRPNSEVFRRGICHICSREFEDVKSHIRDIHTKNEVVCPHCEKPFHNYLRLTNHISTAHSDPSEQVICHICSKMFKNSVYLKQHVRLRHDTVDNPETYVACKECGKSFANKANLYSHHLAVHEVNESRCELCGKTYKNKYALRKHHNHAHRGHPILYKKPLTGIEPGTSIYIKDTS